MWSLRGKERGRGRPSAGKKQVRPGLAPLCMLMDGPGVMGTEQFTGTEKVCTPRVKEETEV